MGVAQRMGAGQIAIRFPAIVSQRASKHGQNPEGIEGLLAPVDVTADPGHRAGGEHLQPEEFAGYAHSGFIRVGNGHGFQGIAQGGHRRRDQRCALRVDRQYRGIGQRQAEQIARQGAATRHRQHGVVRQMNHGCLDPRPVLERRRNLGRGLASMHLTANFSVWPRCPF
jgi:hypothetical protein